MKVQRAWIRFVLHVILLALCVRASEDATDAPTDQHHTTAQPRSSIVSSVRDFLNTALDSVSTSNVARKLLEADVSQECTFGMLKLMRGLRRLEPWAFRLIDASGKYPDGLMQATTADLGAFDECIETVVRDQHGVEKIRGQYCNFHVQMGDDKTLIQEMLPAALLSHWRVRNFTTYLTDPRLPGLRFGICMINDCTQDDLQAIIDTLTGSVVKVKVKNCVTNQYRGMNATEAAITAVLGTIAILIVVSSCIDLYISHKDPRRLNSVMVKCLTSFSIINNTKLILAVNKNKSSETYQYRFIHGIRFLSMVWIALGHSYGTITDNMSRMVNALHYFEHWYTLIVTAGYLGVDTFFFFSGFLLYFTLNKQNRNRIIVAIVAVVRRFIRATIPMFFMIMCMYLLPLIASGPDSNEFYTKFYQEMRKHWWDLLFQLRNWTKDMESSTLPHVWYLSTDFQLFLLSVVIIQVFKSKKWWAAGIFAVLSVVSCAISAWQVHGNDMTPFLVPVTEKLSTLLDTLDNYYILPFYHAVCFFAGCITLLLVEKYREVKISKLLQAALWCVGLSCGLYNLFMKIDWYRSSNPTSEAGKLFYAFSDRIIWSICVAWITFACSTGRGGILNRFLSWDGFVPLSRLSFGVYLIHSPFYLFMYHIARERIFFSHFTLVSQCFSVLVWSYLLSYLMFIACEAPTGHLEKLVFMRERKNTAKTEPDQDKHAEAGRLEAGFKSAYGNGVVKAGDPNHNQNSYDNVCCRL
ncbi:unnamed protein product [Ixodes hexagonus]